MVCYNKPTPHTRGHVYMEPSTEVTHQGKYVDGAERERQRLKITVPLKGAARGWHCIKPACCCSKLPQLEWTMERWLQILGPQWTQT